MIRFFDFLFSSFGIIFLSPLLIIIWIVGWFDNGFPVFKQLRVGQNQRPFILIKFRTMPKGTVSVGTHLVKNIDYSNFSIFLRRNKLDEMPQLWNVLKGDMSLVGPRPCLVNQKKLIIERKKKGVFKAKPGITGLAQISGITMKDPTLLAKIDMKMVRQLNLFYYFYYIIFTFFIFFKKDK
jgi:lipopolysaccharide/colanic/teichoic acid biosynthesis glycosyltransferase